jgi:putative redox protein
VQERIRSGEVTLAAHVAKPPVAGNGPWPAVVIAHGYPSAAGEARIVAQTFPELADRIANEMGWIGLAVALRGCGGSNGSFSLDGWLADLQASVAHVAAMPSVRGVWIAGFGTSGALAICAGAADERVQGVASLAGPADFEDWASHPRRLLEHARDVGTITDGTFPPSFDAWSRALRDIHPLQCVESFAPRPLLLIHGSDDDLVPAIDARVLGDAHGHAEIRIVDGAGHRLRHDPRAVAILLGWLDRQRHAIRSGGG